MNGMKGLPIRIESLGVSYGDVRVLNGIDLTVAPGEFIALLGASGCGKTTLLRALAGFVPIAAGRIEVGGAPVEGLPPERRNMAMMFQSYALWPHMTAAQNIGYGLRLRKWPRARNRRAGTGAGRAGWGWKGWSGATSRACPAGSASASPSPAPSPSILPSCCSTSRSRTWTHGSGRICGTRCAASSSALASPPSS